MDLDQIEEVGLKLYDKIYAFCDHHGIISLARKILDRIKKPTPLEKPACQHSIICNEGIGCGRRNCPARTLKISNYHRRLEAIDFQRFLQAQYARLTVACACLGRTATSR